MEEIIEGNMGKEEEGEGEGKEKEISILVKDGVDMREIMRVVEGEGGKLWVEGFGKGEGERKREGEGEGEGVEWDVGFEESGRFEIIFILFLFFYFFVCDILEDLSSSINFLLILFI